MDPSGPCWTISEKNDFLSQMDKVGGGASEKKSGFCGSQDSWSINLTATDVMAAGTQLVEGHI